MKPWLRETLLWIGIAFLISIWRYMLFLYVSHLPRISEVSMATACERANTLENGIWTFIFVLTIGMIRVVLHELKRRATKPYRKYDSD